MAGRTGDEILDRGLMDRVRESLDRTTCAGMNSRLRAHVCGASLQTLGLGDLVLDILHRRTAPCLVRIEAEQPLADFIRQGDCLLVGPIVQYGVSASSPNGALRIAKDGTPLLLLEIAQIRLDQAFESKELVNRISGKFEQCDATALEPIGGRHQIRCPIQTRLDLKHALILCFMLARLANGLAESCLPQFGGKGPRKSEIVEAILAGNLRKQQQELGKEACTFLDHGPRASRIR